MKYILIALFIFSVLLFPPANGQMSYYNETSGMLEIPIYQYDNLVSYINGDLNDISVFDTLPPISGDIVYIQIEGGGYWAPFAISYNGTAWDYPQFFSVSGGKGINYYRTNATPIPSTWDYRLESSTSLIKDVMEILWLIMALVLMGLVMITMEKKENNP